MPPASAVQATLDRLDSLSDADHDRLLGRMAVMDPEFVNKAIDALLAARVR